MEEKKICVVGLGGAGCKIVERLAGMAQKGPTVAVVSTDRRVLSSSTLPTKIQIGADRTKGLGTGGDVGLGREVAESDSNLVRTLFAGMELAIVVTGLGGGTGSGAAPVVLELARDEGAVALCIATLPFGFEGRERADTASRAVDEVRAQADGVIVVPNDRLVEATSEAKAAEAFVKADEMLGMSIRGLWRLLTHPGYIDLDLASVRKVMDVGGGAGTLACGDGKGKNRMKTALSAVTKGPMVEKGELLAEADSVLVSIAGGSDLLLKEVGDIMDAVKAKAKAEAHIVMGTIQEPAWRSRICVVMVLSKGIPGQPARQAPAKPAESRPKRKPVPSGEKGSESKSEMRQTKLRLDTTSGRGRFQGVEPTVLDGEDLDIPTFIRRGITLEK